MKMKANYIQNPIEWESEFKFYAEVKVRFSETDMFGHLNNTVPFAYFEFARIEFLKHLGFMTDWSTEQQVTKIPVVADLQCDYLKQVFFDETLRIYVKAARIGTTSIDLHYLGKNEKNEPCFTGRGTVVQIDKETGKAIPWDEKEKFILHGK
ncbi:MULTISPECIES: thioesterase family protein [Lysinibacillus]|uniref:Acyl-CoA thioesterase n=1 Tax=Lysinibacillus antri TaxID=2498145 RepID=A0A3S0PNS9_9BACI|nr:MULTISPECIES: thioesterase family protein [Lysinibacillus]RUL51127.1 acyl-CoA thioesterase [Lysinibacillus antri]TSI03172.1 acyl-CoA thioesterase [Lysinibacillus sp. BW-2-10]